MSNEEIKSKEILSRLESVQWSENIARNVSTKYERVQRQNRFIITTSAFILSGALVGIAYFIPNTFVNSNFADVDIFNFLFSDEFSPLYETAYQEEGITSLIEPISYLMK
jgi:hypothetical protein